MKILKNKFKNEINLRTEKDYPIKGIEFIDITPIIFQKETLKEMIDAFVDEISCNKVDYIVAPEARGFLLGAAIATELNVGFIPVRKKGKLSPTVVARRIEYEKEYGKDVLEIPKLVNDDYKDRCFYIVDDVYATGNTVKAIKEAIEDMGGKVIGKGVILNIVELNDDKDIFSLIDINEE